MYNPRDFLFPIIIQIFYEKVSDQQLYNCAYLFPYTVRYIYFIKTSNRSLIPYLTSNNINYLAINKLLAEDILFSVSNEKYQS